LVGVREDDDGRLQLIDRLLQCDTEAVRRVRFERGRVDRDDFLHLRGSELGGHGRDTRTKDSDGHRLTGRELLARGHSFPARAIELARPMFSDDENHPMTRASSLSLRTSSFAASAGDPAISCVFLLFSGAYRATIRCFGAAAASGAATRISFFFAAMMPLR